MSVRESLRVGLLHYSAPPVVGGVESVLHTQARLLIESGYAATILAGRGRQDAFPVGTHVILIPEMDSQHPEIVEISRELEQGRVPAAFEDMVSHLAEALRPALGSLDFLIVHNVFTKHFNLPLTAALFRLLEAGMIRSCMAWCHDFTWTSPNSRSKVHPGYPWDLLRTYHANITYVTISEERRKDLADLLGCLPGQIRVIYNGVEPAELLALSEQGQALIDRLGLWQSDLVLLLPVRVTQAKNIELAIRVVAALKEKDIRATLVITGPPDPHDPKNMEYFGSLLSLREQLELSQHVCFVYESGPAPTEPLLVDMSVVSELFRVSDALFMPSHREGFGMPVLEAGLAGIPVFCSSQVPAANEIGRQDVIRFSPDADPAHVAGMVLRWMENSPVFQLRRRVKQNLSWRSIFRQAILPMLQQALR